MMEMYNRWFESQIEWKLEEIKEPVQRIKFLFKEKKSFLSLNRSDDAAHVIKRFDTLIEQEKLLLEVSIVARGGEKQLDSEKLIEESKTRPLSVEPTPPVVDNPHPRIFTSGIAFKLFEYWHNQVHEKRQLAEYSYIYWAMVKDGYIFKDIRPTEFVAFLNDNFEILLQRLKQYTEVNGGNKIPKYTAIKLSFGL